MIGREIRMQRDVQEAAVGVVVDLGAEVDERADESAGRAVVDLDDAALLGDEHVLAAGIEFERDRLRQPGHHRLHYEVVVGDERRLDVAAAGLLVVENADQSGAGKQQVGARNGNEREVEALGALGQAVVEDGDRDQHAIDAVGDDDLPVLVEEVGVDDGGIRIGRKRHRDVAFQRSRPLDRDIDRAFGFRHGKLRCLEEYDVGHICTLHHAH